MQQHKRGQQVRGSQYGWRHKGRYAENVLEVSGCKGRKVATSAREIAESKQQWGRLPGLRKIQRNKTQDGM